MEILSTLSWLALALGAFFALVNLYVLFTGTNDDGTRVSMVVFAGGALLLVGTALHPSRPRWMWLLPLADVSVTSALWVVATATREAVLTSHYLEHAEFSVVGAPDWVIRLFKNGRYVLREASLVEHGATYPIRGSWTYNAGSLHLEFEDFGALRLTERGAAIALENPEAGPALSWLPKGESVELEVDGGLPQWTTLRSAVGP